MARPLLVRGLDTIHPDDVMKRVRYKAVTDEVAASRKLQGQYIAAIRQVPKSKRKRFADIAKRQGREAAIAAIEKRHKKSKR